MTGRVWLPCPRCGDDRTHLAGAVRKPLPCHFCGWHCAVVVVGKGFGLQPGLPGRVRGKGSMAQKRRNRGRARR